MIARSDLIIEALPEQLRGVTNEDVVAGLALAVRGEHRMTIRTLHYLNEIEARELHLDLGYSSLFDYCVRKLNLSPSGAGRRIQGARCIRRFPSMLSMLENRELSLGAVWLIEPILTEENYEAVIERVRGRSYREIERVAAEFRPPIAYRDRVRPVRVAARPADDLDETLFDRDCAKAYPDSWPPRPTTERKVFVQFLADEEVMELFEEVRLLLTRDGEHLSIAEVLKAVLGEYRERHSPLARQARRAAKKRETSPDSQRWEGGTTGERSRYISPEVRDDVFTRDDGQCAYVADDGTRCGSRHGVQIDHIRPFSTGGSHDLSNLRLLCASHNRRAARRMFGVDMRRHYGRE